MLELKWNKSKDTLTLFFPTLDSNATTIKRVILSKLAKVYDTFGLMSPNILKGKIIFRGVFETKVPCDADIRKSLNGRQKIFKKSLPKEEAASRSIINY